MKVLRASVYRSISGPVWWPLAALWPCEAPPSRLPGPGRTVFGHSYPQHGRGDISQPSRSRRVCDSSGEVCAVMRWLAKDRPSTHALGGWAFMWADGGGWQPEQRPDRLLDLCSLLSPLALNLLPPASRLENLKNDLPDGVSMPRLYIRFLRRRTNDSTLSIFGIAVL